MKDIHSVLVMSDVDDDAWQNNEMNSILEFAIGLGPSTDTASLSRNDGNPTTLSMMDLTERLVEFTSSTEEIMAGEDLLQQASSRRNIDPSGQDSNASSLEDRLHPVIDVVRVLGQRKTEANLQGQQDEPQSNDTIGELDFPITHHHPSTSSYIPGSIQVSSSDSQFSPASYQQPSVTFSGYSVASLLQSHSRDTSSNRSHASQSNMTSTFDRSTIADIPDHQYYTLCQENTQTDIPFTESETFLSVIGDTSFPTEKFEYTQNRASASDNNSESVFISECSSSPSSHMAYGTSFLSMLDAVTNSREITYDDHQSRHTPKTQGLQSNYSSQVPTNVTSSTVESSSLFQDLSDQTMFNITDAFIDYATVEIDSTQNQEPTIVPVENQPHSESFKFPNCYSGTVTICRNEDILRSFQLTDAQSSSVSNDSLAIFESSVASSSVESFSNTKLAQTIRSGMNIRNNVDLDISSYILNETPSTSQNSSNAEPPLPNIWSLDFSSFTSENSEFQTGVACNSNDERSELNTPVAVPLNVLGNQTTIEKINPPKRPHSAHEYPVHSSSSQGTFSGLKRAKASSFDSHAAPTSSETFAPSTLLHPVRPTTLDLNYTAPGAIHSNTQSLVSHYLTTSTVLEQSELCQQLPLVCSPALDISSRISANSDMGGPQQTIVDSFIGLAGTSILRSAQSVSTPSSPMAARAVQTNLSDFPNQPFRRRSTPSLAKQREYSTSSFSSSQASQSLYSPSLDPFIKPSLSDLSPDTLLRAVDLQKIIARSSDSSSSILQVPGPSNKKAYFSRTLSDNSDVSIADSDTSSSFSLASTNTDGEGPCEPVTGHNIKESLRSKLKAKRKTTEYVGQHENQYRQQIAVSTRKTVQVQEELRSSPKASLSKTGLTTRVSEGPSTSHEGPDIKESDEDTLEDGKDSTPKEKSKLGKDKKRKAEEADMEIEDEETTLAKRKKNRIAAQKCRHKKRDKIDMLTRQVKKLEDKQSYIKSEVTRLADEREQLEEMLRLHSMVCSLKGKGKHSTDK